MSAKDANPAGEVGKANNKDGDLIESPNITHASADESEPYIDAKEEARKAARKKAETVEIDGVPIDEKDLKFKAGDIKRKGADDYFVNVDRREIEKKERRRAKAEEAIRRKEENRSRAKKLRQQIKNFFFKGWHKFAFIGVIVAMLVGSYFIWVHPKILAEIQRREEEALAAQIAAEEAAAESTADMEAKLRQANEYIESHDIDMAMPIYEDLLKNITEPEYKIRIYVSRSRLLFNSNQYSEEYRDLELSDAKAAYEVDHESFEAVGWLVEFYTRTGNKTEAEKYEAIQEELFRKAAENEENNIEGAWG